MLQGRRKFAIHACLSALLLGAGRALPQEKTNEGEEIYSPGGGVKAPKLTRYVEPQFSRDAKEAYVEGTVKISIVVTVDGMPTDCKVVRGLTDSQDRAAMEAVQQWRFQAGTKDGKPVKVRVTAEVGFHLL